jgi:hypothetical protein
MGNGKYKKWLEQDGLIKLEGWARSGLTDAQISKNIGICCGTLYDWKNRFPEISDALKKGKEVVDFEVENALLKRALGYEYEEVVSEVYTERSKDGTDIVKEKHVKKVKKTVPPDTPAAIFWLKNRKPTDWRNNPPTDADRDALSLLDKVIERVDDVVHTEAE